MFCISLTQTGYPFLFRAREYFSEEPSEQRLFSSGRYFLNFSLIYRYISFYGDFLNGLSLPLKPWYAYIDQRCFAVIQKNHFVFSKKNISEAFVKKQVDLTKHLKFSLINSPLFFSEYS